MVAAEGMMVKTKARDELVITAAVTTVMVITVKGTLVVIVDICCQSLKTEGVQQNYMTGEIPIHYYQHQHSTTFWSDNKSMISTNLHMLVS